MRTRVYLYDPDRVAQGVHSSDGSRAFSTTPYDLVFGHRDVQRLRIRRALGAPRPQCGDKASVLMEQVHDYFETKYGHVRRAREAWKERHRDDNANDEQHRDCDCALTLRTVLFFQSPNHLDLAVRLDEADEFCFYHLVMEDSRRGIGCEEDKDDENASAVRFAFDGAPMDAFPCMEWSQDLIVAQVSLHVKPVEEVPVERSDGLFHRILVARETLLDDFLKMQGTVSG